MEARVIYLDNNATTKPSPGVRAAVVRAMEEAWQNPSSAHRGGQAARRAVELARKSAASIVGVRAREVIFCGDGTEAIEMAVRGRVGAMRMAGVEKPIVATDEVEHSAVRDLVKQMHERGEIEAVWLGLGPHGVVDVDGVRHLDPYRTAAVSVQWANNETGVVQPIETLASACLEQGVALLVDGTQWVGKVETDLGRPELAGVSMLSYSPHKFHGPKGIGVLVSRRGTRLAVMRPGSQELGRRGGTENVPGILGAGVACEEAMAFLGDPSGRARVMALRDRFEQEVLDVARDVGVVASVNGPTEPACARLWNTTNIGFHRLEAEAVLLALSERGVLASAGAACSSGSLEPSPILRAMGVAPEVAHGSVRFSLSRETTSEEIDRAVEVVGEVLALVGRSMLA